MFPKARLKIWVVACSVVWASQLWLQIESPQAAAKPAAGAAPKARPKPKGFGDPQPPKTEEGIRKLRLGKLDQIHEKRQALIADTFEQVFPVGASSVKLFVPSYVMDYAKFEAMVEVGAGTVADIVWPAEQALATALMERRHLWISGGLCELGAGLGLAGIAAAMNGAPSVLLTDRDALVLEVAKRSAQNNNVADKVAVSAFDWADRASWPKLPGRLVIAADVLYDKEVVKPLASLILHLGGEALLMEPNNEERQELGSLQYFKEVIREKGLTVYVEDYSPPGGVTPMVLLQVSKSKGPTEGTEVFDAESQKWVQTR